MSQPNINESLKLRLTHFSSVKEWKENPRKNETSIEKLAKLLALNGQRSPIVVWSKNNVIYKGNATYKAYTLLRNTGVEAFLSPEELAIAKKNQFTSEFHENLSKGLIWCLFEDFPSQAAAVAYGIADNRAAEWSSWDNNLLVNLLTSQAPQPVLTGFSERELKILKKKIIGEGKNRWADSMPKLKIVVEVDNAEQMEFFENLFEKEASGMVLFLNGDYLMKFLQNLIK